MGSADLAALLAAVGGSAGAGRGGRVLGRGDAPPLETALATTTPEPPDFFTVEEAARVLRIGRTAAYALSRKWRETEGREGLPVVPVGRLLRVPRSALEEMTGGRITTSPTTPNQPVPSRGSEDGG